MRERGAAAAGELGGPGEWARVLPRRTLGPMATGRWLGRPGGDPKLGRG